MSETDNCILLGDEGLRFYHGPELLFWVRWSHVREIIAYKEDLFGCDSICIAFRVGEADDYLRVFEEAAGFKEMLTELERRFPEIRRDWFNDVAFPAFIPNWTTIWGQPLANESK